MSERGELPRLVVVSATRCDERAFASGTLLGRSLAMAAHQGLEARISYNNQQALAISYNAAIEQASSGDLLIFCHDDVWLGEQSLAEPLLEGLNHFEVIGVAGNTRLAPGHSTWRLQPSAGQPDHPFHFYDLDVCRTARVARLRLGGWPQDLIYASTGTPGSRSWQNALQVYR